MDQDLKRISSELRLPQDSRERIRTQLASCQRQQEDIPMKKTLLKTRIPLIAAAVILAMAFTLTAGAVAVQFFRNDIIVDSREDIPDSADGSTPSAVGITSPSGNSPFTLEEMIERAGSNRTAGRPRRRLAAVVWSTDIISGTILSS